MGATSHRAKSDANMVMVVVLCMVVKSSSSIAEKSGELEFGTC